MGFISNMNRSLELDEKAKERSSKAYEINELVNQQRIEKEKQVEKALNKLINRKKAKSVKSIRPEILTCE